MDNPTWPVHGSHVMEEANQTILHVLDGGVAAYVKLRRCSVCWAKAWNVDKPCIGFISFVEKPTICANYSKNQHRLADNPQEVVAVNVWKVDDLLPQILGTSSRPFQVTQRDREVADILMQWLGSPVGQHYCAKLLDMMKEVG